VTRERPVPVRLARRLAHGVVRGYPSALNGTTPDTLTFLDDALDDAWRTSGATGLLRSLTDLVRDVIATRWRGPGYPLTSRPSPAANRNPRGSRFMDLIRRDLRQALRRLASTPSLSIAAILTLALTIGATTAVFTVVDQSMLRPLPYPDAERMMVLMERNGRGQVMSVAWPNYQDWMAQNSSFAELGLYRNMAVNLTGIDRAERLSAALVSASVFTTTGIAAARGRTFAAADDVPTTGRIAIISERLWRTRFGAREDLLNSDITLNGLQYTVVGIMPPGMRYPSRQTDVWLPLGQFVSTFPTDRGNHPGLYAVGRLKETVSLDRARQDMDAIAKRLSEQYPQSNTNVTVTITPYLESVFSFIRPAYQLLLGAVALLLCIGCANLASLLLAQGESRYREIAVRAALGAGRAQIVRQLVLESMLLAFAGGAIGIVGAAWAVRVFVASSPSVVPRIDLVGLDGRVLVVAIGMTLLSALLFGLAPAFRTSAVHLQSALATGTRSVGASLTRVRGVLVIAEVALAVLLLVGAGLFTRSFARLSAVELGFDPGQALTMRLLIPDAKYPTRDAWVNFHRDLIARLAATPGVAAAGISSAVPLAGGASESFVMREGDPLPSPQHQTAMCMFQTGSAGFYQALGVTMLRGRWFDERDTATSERIVVVDDTLAARLFGSADPIGQRIAFEGSGHSSDAFQPTYRTVIGVVRHVTHYGLTGEPPYLQVFTPYTQMPQYMENRRPGMAIAVRATGDPDALVSTIRSVVASLDPDIPVYSLQTMTSYVQQASEQPRLSMMLLGAFAVLALVLAVIGVSGVLAYAVARRTREIGVRMALGARPREIASLVGRQATLLVGIGLIIGIAAAFACSKLVEDQLFGVVPNDPWTFAGVAGVLIVAAAGAAYLPARRAATVDPLVALRAE
jgi:putative ABC transport system permease protein